MFPRYPIMYVRDCASAEAEHFPYDSSGHRSFELSYLSNHFFVGLCHSVFAPSWSPSLGCAIKRIIMGGARLQMLCVYTRGIVAGMQGIFIGPNIGGQKKSDSVRTVIASDTRLSGRELSIAVLVFLTFPMPAVSIRAKTGRLVDIALKSLDLLCGQVGRCYSAFSHSLSSFVTKIMSRAAASVERIRTARFIVTQGVPIVAF